MAHSARTRGRWRRGTLRHEAAVLTVVVGDVGEVVPGGRSLRLAEPGGATSVLTEPMPDPYWPAYARAVAEGWE